MPSPADFLENYQNCKTHRDANNTYKSLILENNPMTTETLHALQESLRLAHVRIVEVREAPVTTGIVRIRRDNSDVNDTAVRSWARVTGYVMPRSDRVTNEVRDAYRVAHNLPIPEAPDARQLPPEVTKQKTGSIPNPKGIDISLVRAWAVANGIPVGARGRVKPEIIEQYQEAHGD